MVITASAIAVSPLDFLSIAFNITYVTPKQLSCNKNLTCLTTLIQGMES